MFRHTSPRLFQRPLAERFWSPFNRQITGADVGKYGIATALERITDPASFSCTVNGICGNAAVAEDFFVVLLTGFDIEGAQLFPGAETDTYLDGCLNLVHTRPFLGWKPTQTAFKLPFAMQVECASDFVISHVNLKAPVAEALVAAGCPPEVAEITKNAEAMRMLTTLRRVKVKPEVISLNALKSASKTQPKWSSALGIM